MRSGDTDMWQWNQVIIDSGNARSLMFLKIFTCFDFQNFASFNAKYIDGLVQDCSNSIANALELLQSCTKSSIYDLEESFVKMHLPKWQFYFPRTVGQWDKVKSSHEAITWNNDGLKSIGLVGPNFI